MRLKQKVFCLCHAAQMSKTCSKSREQPFQPALENGRSSGFSSLTRLPANQECSGFQWVRKRRSYSSGYCERFTRSSLLASCRETGGTVSERKSRGFLWIDKWAKTFFWKFPFPMGCPTRRRNVTSPSSFLIFFVHRFVQWTNGTGRWIEVGYSILFCSVVQLRIYTQLDN